MTTMDTPTTTRGIAEALADLQTQLPRIAKDQTAKVPTKAGGSYQYSYADLAQISRELLPIMGKLGLSFTACPTLVDGRFVLAYELLHTSGQSRTGVYPLPSSGTPQEVGGAITYARRYCLCAVTGVAPDSDDDDAVVAEKAAARRNRRDGRGQPNTTGDDSPAAITAKQQRDMQELFKKLAIVDREDKLNYAVGVVQRPPDRPLRSAAELSRDEADRVIAGLTADVADLTAPAEEPKS